MPSVRNLPRPLLAALVVLANTLVTDSTAVLRRTGNRLLSLIPLAAVVTDITAVRAEVVKLVTDITALRTTVAAVVVDLGAIRTKILDTQAKLDLDAGVTDTDYVALHGPAALTSSAPSAITAANPAAVTASATVGITDGTAAGYLKLRADAEYCIGGTFYRKAAADDVWNLSAQTDTTGAQYRAYWLYLDSSGTASIGAGSNAASAVAAIAALPAITSTKAVIGCYVAGLSTDFDGVAGLAAQGTIYNGHPGEAAIDALTSAAITVVNV